MIEVNLLPGSAKRTRRRGVPKLKLGKLGGGGSGGSRVPKLDRGLLLLLGGWAAGVLLLSWMFLGGRARKAELTAEIEAAVLDSARLAQIIQSTQQLEARMRLVSTKLNVVQEIDAGRFIWPHIMDELARAVPEHTWLKRFSNMQTDSGVKYPKITVEGRTGNNFALTKYLQQLEASPFIRQVRLKESQLVRENDKLIYAFMLEADYESPPVDMIETVPLFANQAEGAPLDSVAPQLARTNAPRSSKPRPGPNAPAGKPGTQEPR